MKNQRNKEIDSNKSQNRIGHGTTIEGDITSTGGFRIDGTINGTLKTDDKVVIGKEGVLNGTLECNNADVEGTVSGKLLISSLLTLKSSSKIDGEVITSKLAVEPGATFNASCNMQSGVKTLGDRQDKTA